MEVRRLYNLGRSLALTLPKAYAKSMKLHEGDLVVVTLGEREFRIRPLVDIAGPDRQSTLRLGGLEHDGV